VVGPGLGSEITEVVHTQLGRAGVISVEHEAPSPQQIADHVADFVRAAGS
jgi:hypothetical protein